MALFKKSSTQKEYFNTATIITKDTHSMGGFIGEDSIHIDGTIHGDVKVNNVVIIGQTGMVNGNIKAKQVISSGTCYGNILCDSLELLETSETTSKIKSNKILVKGKLKGNITCGGLFVHQNALIDTDIQAKSVVAGGTIRGTIICKQLKILASGHLKGKIFADRILNQGGHVEGFIGRYSELVENNPQLLRYAHIFNASDETILLEYSDYYVHVDKEIESQSTQDDNATECIDTDFYIEDQNIHKIN